MSRIVDGEAHGLCKLAVPEELVEKYLVVGLQCQEAVKGNNSKMSESGGLHN